jgi:hypothetical protein
MFAFLKTGDPLIVIVCVRFFAGAANFICYNDLRTQNINAFTL